MEQKKIVATLLVAFCLVTHILAPWSYAGENEAIKQHNLLKQREQQIVAEMLQVQLQLEQTQRELVQVQSKLNQIRTEIPVSQQQLGESEKSLRLYMERLKIWLKHFYVEGRTNYLVMLLGAIDLADFLNRLTLVGILVSQGIKDVNKANEIIDEVKLRTNQLANLERDLQEQESKVVQIMERNIALRGAKEELLEQTKKELGENQRLVLSVVAGLYEALKPLENVLERFKDAPWDKYQPDRLQFTGKKVLAEYSQNTIARLLFQGMGQSNSTTVSFSNKMLVIKGASEQVKFTIAGELLVSEGSVCYKPKVITIGEIALTPDLVEMISGKNGLIYPVDMLMGWRLTNITVYEGKAVFELVPA